MKNYINEIEEKLSALPSRTSSQIPESYIGGGQSKLQYIGLRVPHLQQVLKNGFSFSSKSNEELAEIWDYVWWNSNCYEILSLGLSWFYDKKQKSIINNHWIILKKWSLKIDNWAHSDTLSGIYARLLEENPEKIYPTLLKWNSSKKPWLRRLSIVSLIYYSPQRKRVLPFNKIIALLEPQLDYDHYYVQKGVGWTLRETYNVYPGPTFKFMEKNIKKISSIAFSASTEKMSTKEKNHLKKLRKLK